MSTYKDFFAGKKITLMGLGLLGRGVGDARFLAECGADLIVTDLKSETDLATSLAELKDFKNITFRLGGHDLGDFQDRDLIIKAAGVPLDSPFIAEARKNTIPVRMSSDLFAELAGVPIVGITGTRGKSTVTHMIAHILKQAGKKVLLGGNVRGVSTLAQISEVTEDIIPVLELDSWQLQGFGEAKMSPHIAVFTNLMSDHQNYYPDEVRYFNDKANIFRFQKAGDVLIAGQAVTNRWIRSANPPVEPVVPQPIPRDWGLKLLGEHNKENASFAAEASRRFGLTEQQIKAGVESFEPVEGRLQLIREIGAVKIYNDNNATTPDATIAALAALSDKAGEIVLIIGGADKGLHLEMLAKMMPPLVKGVVLLKGTGTEKLKPLLKLNSQPIEVTSMPEAVQIAMNFAQNKGVVLFSPGFASFGMFKNEYDRNDQFNALVARL